MFSFFKKKIRSAPPPAPSATPEPPALAAQATPHGPSAPDIAVVAAPPAGTPAKTGGSLIGSALVTPIDIPQAIALAVAPERQRWFSKLQAGLRKTGSSISTVFSGNLIDDQLYEDLETALLMADTGVNATEHLLIDVKRRVREGGMTHPVAVKNALIESITVLLKPLEKPLVIGEYQPTVIMVTGVNGAGKTTSIGKLTRHLANEGASVLLAAADTFRAAAREQLAIWGERNGRLPTQLHLMEELRKIKRVVQKADATAPHEVLLVIDGNTGQNALSQVKAFDDTLQLTGLIVTKLDGTAKGGVLAAIALWARERAKTSPDLRPVAVYFIGVGEKLEDLETFNAREFAQALLG